MKERYLRWHTIEKRLAFIIYVRANVKRGEMLNKAEFVKLVKSIVAGKATSLWEAKREEKKGINTMSKEWRNECVSCDLPCIGDACPYRHVPYLICDDCGAEYEDRLYIFNGQELCSDCIADSLPKSKDEFDVYYLFEGEWLLLEDVLKELPSVTIDDMTWEGEV